VIADTPQHTYQVLTKRSSRLRRLADKLKWPPNLWMGVSVENSGALFRLSDLQAVPAAVRFLSCEPLIGPLEGLDLDGIGWLIAGGESGPGRRPLNPDWITGIRDSCLSGLARKFVGGRDHAARAWGWVLAWASMRCSRSLRSVRVNFQLNGFATAL
jgi:protein gp37